MQVDIFSNQASRKKKKIKRRMLNTLLGYTIQRMKEKVSYTKLQSKRESYTKLQDAWIEVEKYFDQRKGIEKNEVLTNLNILN